MKDKRQIDATLERQFLEKRLTLGSSIVDREKALCAFISKHLGYPSDELLQTIRTLVPDLKGVFQFSPAGISPDQAASNALRLFRTNSNVVTLHNGCAVSVRNGDDVGSLKARITQGDGVGQCDSKPTIELLPLDLASLKAFAGGISKFLSKTDTVAEAIKLAGAEAEDPVYLHIADWMYNELEAGKYLSDVVAKYPRLFNENVVEQIKAIERDPHVENRLDYHDAVKKVFLELSK